MTTDNVSCCWLCTSPGTRLRVNESVGESVVISPNWLHRATLHSNRPFKFHDADHWYLASAQSKASLLNLGWQSRLSGVPINNSCVTAEVVLTIDSLNSLLELYNCWYEAQLGLVEYHGYYLEPGSANRLYAHTDISLYNTGWINLLKKYKLPHNCNVCIVAIMHCDEHNTEIGRS